MQEFHPPVTSQASIHLQKSGMDLNSIKSVLDAIHQQPLSRCMDNPGSTDPFDFESPLSDASQSEDDMSISISLTVDNTFSFIRQDLDM
jgi:hypothetical protein